MHVVGGPESTDEIESKEEYVRIRNGRRSGIMSVMDFVRRHGLLRQFHHRKVVDLTQSVNAAEMSEIERSVKNKKKSLLSNLCGLRGRSVVPLVMWLLWILVGTLFYSYCDGLGWAFGFFQSINIGWSVGWVLPPHHAYEANTLSTIFSLLHTIVGMLFLSLGVLFIASELGSGNRGEALQRGTQGQTKASSTGKDRIAECQASLQKVLPKIKLNIFFMGWFIVGCGWFWISFQAGFLSSSDYTLSTVAGAGYKGIPEDSRRYQYVFSAFFAAIAIPLTRISEGWFVGFCTDCGC